MTDLDDLDPVLSSRVVRQLAHAADDAPLRGSPLASIVARAERRRHRRRAAGTVGAVVVVVGAATIALAAGRPQGSVVPAEPSPSVSAPTAITVPELPPPTTAAPAVPEATHLDAAGLRWTSGALDDHTAAILEASSDVVWDDTATLTWTPNPDNSTPSELYRTTDGVTFTAVEPGPGLVVLGGTSTGDRIDLIGHLPVTDSVPTPVAGLTLASWTPNEPWSFRAVDLVLPNDLSSDPTVAAEHATIARLDGSIVATVTILTPTRTVTKVLLIPPRGAITDLSDPLIADGVTNAVVTSDGERYLLTAFHRQGTAEDPSAIPPVDLFTSTDGATWTTLASPPIVLGQVERVDGSMIAAGLVPGGEWVSINRDGNGWEPFDLDVVADAAPDSWQLVPGGLAVGPDIVAIAALGPADATGMPTLAMFVSVDLESWEFVDLDVPLGGGYSQLLSIGWVDGRLVTRVSRTDPGAPLGSSTRLIIATPSS